MSNQDRRPRTLSLWALCLGLGPISALPGFASEIAPADHVVVHKAEHKLYLYNGSHLLGAYKVALGLSPVGTKEREHDFRTPEGRYFLARRNTRSDYFLSIQVRRFAGAKKAMGAGRIHHDPRTAQCAQASGVLL
jgi:hypothetical protein